MTMAERRKYSPSAGSEVKSEMHRYKRGTAESGPGGRGGARRGQLKSKTGHRHRSLEGSQKGEEGPCQK
jgi:hypothetical protein